MNSGSNAKAKSCGSDTKNIKKVKTAHQNTPKPRTQPPQNRAPNRPKTAHLNTSKTRNKTPQKHVIKVDKQRKIG